MRRPAPCKSNPIQSNYPPPPQELALAKEQVRSATGRADTALTEVKRSEAAAAAAAAQMEALQKGLAESRKQVEEAHEKLVKEKGKKRKLEDEAKLLSSKVERLRKVTNAGSAAKELQDEIDAMRQLLNCNVCHVNQKNVIITKCCHVFCDKCIKRNLEARNRKCPGCGNMYSAGDVKPLHL
jgi:E3 ubiquitin-protein ligase BRE1